MIILILQKDPILSLFGTFFAIWDYVPTYLQNFFLTFKILSPFKKIIYEMVTFISYGVHNISTKKIKEESIMIPLTHDEVEDFFNYLDNNYFHKAALLFLKLQYYYGRRSEEIVRLRVCDLDLVQNRITFHIAKKKEDSTINLRLIPKVCDGLDALIKKMDLQGEDYIFIYTIDDNDTYIRTVREFLERESCKITGKLFGKQIMLNTHDFCRMGGQHLYLAGYKLEHLQKLYQHVDINHTIDYLQIDEIDIDNLLDYYC